MQNGPDDHNGIKLENNNRNTRKISKTQKLNNKLVTNHGSKRNSKENFPSPQKYIELNEKSSTN